MTRLPGWPEALAREVSAAAAQPYRLGEHDCLRFSCRCIEALTGADYWPRFAGYTTRREALRTIARIAPNLGEAVSIVLDADRQPGAFARRGDLVLYRDEAGEHLGICLGATVAVLGETGLVRVSLGHVGVLGCWRIG